MQLYFQNFMIHVDRYRYVYGCISMGLFSMLRIEPKALCMLVEFFYINKTYSI
jgi:hypothetical protein